MIDIRIKQQVDTQLAENKLHQFVKQAWGQVEPKSFVDGWHLQAICDHLEAVSKGDIRNLVINIPPRHTKSLTVSVMWPAWEWNHRPQRRWMFTSYSQRLSIRDSVKCRRIIQSPWYQERWSKVFQLTGDQNAKELYETNKGGYRLATSIGGMGTGSGGDVIVVDDPHSVMDVDSDIQREAVHEWWDSAMSTRRDDPKKGSRVIIMQRTHANDLCGHVMDKMGADYDFLILPAEYEPKAMVFLTSLGFKDPRKEVGELLWPERFGKEEIEEQKRNLGSHHYSAQFQQRPSLAEGSIFKRNWFKHYTKPPALMAEEMDFICQSWDMTFKDTKSSDFVAGQVWGLKGSNRYLLDQERKRMSFTETLKAVRAMTLKWPKATAKYIEEKANGAAVIDSLRNEVDGLIAINPKESKESRAFSVTPEFEAGNVWFPDPSFCAWVDAYIESLASFPKGPYDDDVDATTQALERLKQRVKSYERAVAAPLVTTGGKSNWGSFSISK
jgi:predicted phage terminase large subunit-like protein